MLVAEIYKFEDNKRLVETNEFLNRDGLNKHLFTLIMQGLWVGHKVYNTTLTEYSKLSSVEKARAVIEQKFDKEAYIDKRRNT